MHIDLFTYKDNIIQMANCSYDVHVQEIIGSLIVGSSLIFLRHQGNMDFEYVLTTLNKKQISYMQTVPVYLDNLCVFLQNTSSRRFDTLRTLDIGGKIVVLVVIIVRLISLR
jgi:hypothetical protein